MPLNFCLYLVRGCFQTNRKIFVKIPLRRTRFIQSLKDCMVLPIHIHSTFYELKLSEIALEQSMTKLLPICQKKPWIMHSKPKVSFLSLFQLPISVL